MGVFQRILGRKQKSARKPPAGLGRTLGHRGVGGASAPAWEMLSADEVEAFVYFGAWLPVQSTNVKVAQYDGGKEQLLVEFLNGSLYLYSNVSEQEALEFARAFSKGKWVWSNLRGRGLPPGQHLKPYQQLR